MQVECPKCHFRQPEDRFCARCGIDMKAYKPPEKSFVEKILQNATLIFLVGMILLSSGLFFYFKSTQIKNEIVDIGRKTIFISSHKSQTQNGSTSGSAESESSSNIQANDQTANKTISGEMPMATNDTTNAGAEAFANSGKEPNAAIGTNSSTNSQTPSANNQKSHSLVIQYGEVTKKGFYALEDEAKTSGQFISSDYSQGVINFGNQKIRNLKGDIKIYSQDKKSIREGKMETWFQGLKSSNDSNNIGLTTEFKIKEIQHDRILADLKILKRFQVNLSDPNSKNFQTLEYLGSLEIADEQVYFITDVLTTQPLLAQMEYLTSISPFEILKSFNFKNDETISVFFYNFEK